MKNTYLFIFHVSDTSEVYVSCEHGDTEEEAWNNLLETEFNDEPEDSYPTMEQFLEDRRSSYIDDLETTIMIPGIHKPEIN